MRLRIFYSFPNTYIEDSSLTDRTYSFYHTFTDDVVPPGYQGDASFPSAKSKIRDFFEEWNRMGVKEVNGNYIPFHAIRKIQTLP